MASFTEKAMDAKLYKVAREKQYETWVCKPPVGTCVFDSFYHRDICMNFKKLWISSLEYAQYMQNYGNTDDAYIVRNCMVGEQDFVIIDAAGNFRKIYLAELQKGYVLASSGVRFNTDNLSMDSCVLTTAESGLQYYKAALKSEGSIPIFDWVKVRRIPDPQPKLAVHIPKDKRFTLAFLELGNDKLVANTVKTNHGKGDFVVCSSPVFDPSRLRLMNGLAFSHQFNNQGWLNEVVPVPDIPKPASMYRKSVQTKVSGGTTSRKDLILKVMSEIKHGVESGRLVLIGGKVLQDEGLEIIELGSEIFITCIGRKCGFDLSSSDSVRVKWNKASGGLTLKELTESTIRQYIMLFCSIVKRGWESNIYTAPCDEATLDAINAFSGYEFTPMNAYMRGELTDDLSFQSVVKVSLIYDYLQRCRVRNIPLFRGIKYAAKVGQTLKFTSFSSWSASINSAQVFGDNVYIVTNNDTLNAVYINSISQFRDSEFEFLLKSGYLFHVDRVLSMGDKKLYFGRLIRDDTYFFKGLTGADETALNYLTNEFMRMDVCNYYSILFNEPDEIVFTSRYTNLMYRFYEDSKGWGIYKNGKLLLKVDITKLDETAQAVNEFLMDKMKDVQFDPAVATLFELGSRMMYRLVGEFQREKFQILNLRFIDVNDMCQVFTGTLTVSGDNDDNIAIKIRMDSETKMQIAAKSQSKGIRKEFEATDPNTASEVYKAVVHTFKLNQWGRIERGLAMVARYRKQELKKSDEGMYLIGGVGIIVVIDGSNIRIRGLGDEMIFDFWTNLMTIASLVNERVGERI